MEIEVEYLDPSEDGEPLDGKDASPSGGEEIDIDVGSPPSDENGLMHPPQQQHPHPHPHPQPGHDVLMIEDMLPASRSNSGLGVRGEREGGGAETEVEGEGSGAGILSRMRASRRGNTPSRAHANAGGSGSAEGASPVQDFAADEQDEDMMDLSQHQLPYGHSHHGHGHLHLHAGGGVAAEMGGVVLATSGEDGDDDDGVDLDGTVGAKRKR